MSNEAIKEKKRPNYWKSLNELAKNKEYEEYAGREFRKGASELSDGLTRKSFLQLMGASVALAGFASCRRPVEKLMPYSNSPEDIIPGEALYYASAVPFQDALTGLVIKTTDGRPIKIEGNELHPASLGNTSIYQQAELLSMYDPDRSQTVRKDGEESSYTLFQSFCQQHFKNTNQSIAFISAPNSSPTYNGLKKQALQKFPNAKWVTYAAFGEDNVFEGTRMALGQRLRPIPHFEEAKVMVSLDDDFMNPAANKNSVRNTATWVKTRKLASLESEISRLYVIESAHTLTGSNADSRLRLKSSEIPAFIYALAGKLSESVNGLGAFGGVNNKFSSHAWADEIAKDLLQNRGEAIVSVGDEHAPEVHAAVAAINVALGNAGSTVTYHQVPHIDQQNNKAIFADLVQQMKQGAIDTAVIVGVNPAFTAPADLAFEEALKNVGQVITLADYYDETSQLANWHVNKAHFLEAWMDGYSYAGVSSIIQPTISPLFEGKSPVEFLNTVVNGQVVDGYDLVQKTWRNILPSGNFKKSWETVLHDGLYKTEPFPQVIPAISTSLASSVSQAVNTTDVAEGIELVIRPDSTLFDGRYANNAWLQELPDPMTKITWDNVAKISPATAKKLGVEKPELGRAYMDLLEITVDGRKVEIAAWIQPGHADDSITVTVGYGRKNVGKVGNGIGVNTYPLRTSKTLLFATNVAVKNTGKRYPVASTQDHHNMEGRDLIKYATIEEYREHSDFAHFYEDKPVEMPGQSYDDEEAKEGPLSIFNPLAQADYPDYEPQWGMAIDLNACTGCGVCTIACQAENNIPIVGKERVGNGREMHWIRTDRYYAGDVNNPAALHQPVPCMQCELAPCEQVCPVAATTHSDDGINQMTYNRCIGTRYCLNNCPYKVRRFNFFNYSQEFLTGGEDPEIIQMAMNPEVTVRFRGVMEKCTYCVQRINKAKIETEIATDGATRKPADGTVQTACQQACPADAFAFGDLTDTESEVYKTKLSNRNYLLLAELNTRPRTSYLAKITNPNPALAEHATTTLHEQH